MAGSDTRLGVQVAADGATMLCGVACFRHISKHGAAYCSR